MKKKQPAKAKVSETLVPESPQLKILLFDIETAPNLARVWGYYEQNVLEIVQERYILCFAAKWFGQDEVIVKSIRDYKGYKPLRDCDKGLVQDLWKLFDEADIIIAHFGNKFDIPMANSRFLKYGFNPPSFYRTIDTKKEASRHFRQNSNKLNDLGKFLGVGEKNKHHGYDTWADCMAGVQEAWDEMLAYNRQDVLLLERVYLKLRPWMTQHPNLNVIMDRDRGCSKCGAPESSLVRRGYRSYVWTNLSRAPRFRCKVCGGYTQGQYKKVASERSA